LLQPAWIGRASDERGIHEYVIDRADAARVPASPGPGRKKPATGFRLWLVFNCVLLQQSVKFD
jgi:hypothetical protein